MVKKICRCGKYSLTFPYLLQKRKMFEMQKMQNRRFSVLLNIF